MSIDCIFCKIIKREQESQILMEDGHIVAVNDINPKAPVHILILSKKHIPSINEVGKEDIDLVGKMIFNAKKLAKQNGLADKGYKLIFNVGKGGGQVIDHIHLHLLGGWKDVAK